MGTTTVQVRRAGAAVLALLLTALPQRGMARQSPPSTLDQLEWYLAVGIPPESILERVQQSCLAFPVDADAEQKLREAGATEGFLAGLRSVCQGIWEVEVDLPMWVQLQPPTPLGSAFLHEPRSAALKSLALPGLGQISTGRPGPGALFMAGWAGALGVGLLTREVTVDCGDWVDGRCPADEVLEKRTERPLLAAGVGTAVALAALSAWDAWSGARRANARRVASAEGPSLGSFSVELLPGSQGGSAKLDLARLRFRWLGGQGPIAAATGRAERSTVPVETPEPTLNTAVVDSLRVRLVEISDQVRLADFTWAFEILEEVGVGIQGLRSEFPDVPAVEELDREFRAAYRATWARCDLVRRIMLERGEGSPPVCREPPRGGGHDPS